VRALQGAGKILEQGIERSQKRVFSRDENIVIAGKPIKGKDRRSHGPEPPLGAIALDGISDLLARRKSHADATRACFGFRRRADFEGQRRQRAADTTGGTQEIGTFFQAIDPKAGAAGFVGDAQAESFLRPWARRRARTLRPPAVVARARKPWRRLRTILLG
jgi:hypothetical protein